MNKKPLLPAQKIKALLPLKEENKQFIESSRATCKKILTGDDPRLALIVGPCSIHDPNAAWEYAEKWKHLSKENNHFFMIFRAFHEKPRTKIGWKGLLYDPYLDGSNKIEMGLILTRQSLLRLTEMEIPLATEFVDPMIAPYIDDLISWGFIGARTSSSQPHRQFASSLSFPVGFKNNVNGNIDVALHGVSSAHISHTFLSFDDEGRVCKVCSDGNPFAHLVLRGSNYGDTNYDPFSIQIALQKIRDMKLKPRLIIDCSHGNCQKKYKKQVDSFQSVIHQVQEKNLSIRGLMLESYLRAGNQILGDDPSSLTYGTSITDPCLSWEQTEEVIQWAEETLSSSRSIRGVQN